MLGDFSVAPRYIETIRKRGYRTVAELDQGKEVAAHSWLEETPFRGLAPFEERHSGVFFGRTDATRAVLNAIDRQHRNGRAVVLVLGPSGSGKTSLIRAGVMARLIDRSAPLNLRVGNNLYFDCADLAETDRYRALGSVLLDAEDGAGAPLFEHDSAASLGARLAEAPDAVIERLREAAPTAGAATVTALFIDRFEALLRNPAIGEAGRGAFIALLDRLAHSGAVLVLLACRNDFYPHLAGIGALMALKPRGGHVDVAAPSGAELAQMVRQPARAAGLRFGARALDGAALDDELCAAARDRPDSLPLLQYCLEELYRQRTADGELSFEVYQQLGGIDGAIGARAEQVLTRLSTAQMAALPHVLSLLVQVAEDELAVTARPAPWSALALDDALALNLRETAILQGLHAKTPDNAAWKMCYAFALSHTAEMHWLQGRQPQARADLGQGVELMRAKVPRDPTNAEVQRDLDQMEVKLLDMGGDTGAGGWTASHERLDKTARQQADKPRLARVAAQARLLHARQLLRQRQPAAAAAMLAPALSELEQLQSKLPTDKPIARIHVDAMLLQTQLGGDAEADRAMCLRARASLGPGAADSLDYEVLAQWVRTSICAGLDAQASRQMKLLENMKYREPHFIRFIAARANGKGGS